MVTGNYLPFNFHSLFFLIVFFYGGAFMFRLFGFFICAFPFLVASLSCDSTEPPAGSGAKFTLAVEDSSCTEVWLKLTTSNIPLPATLSLEQNNTTIDTLSITSADTLLYVDGLLPKQTYKFRAVLTDYQQPTSSEVTAQTMDTTSHNFTWQSWEFGEHSSSVLYDVAIIDENNIWAVGEIYMNDSLGDPDPHAYNAVHWDGTEWELKRILFPTVCGSTNRTPYPAKSLFAFQDGEIWIGSSGDKIAILENGVQVSEFCLPSSLNMGINKIWGTSSNDLYVVGNGGNIAHYSGPSGGWQKIESGTDLDIYDIWGDVNPQTGEYDILIVAAEQYRGPRRKILKLLNNVIEELSTENIPDGSLNGIWFKSGRKYFAVGNGIYTKPAVENSNEWIALHPGLTPYYIYAIRGSSFNNIFLCGSFGESLHFNGMSWKTFKSTPGFFDVEFLNTDIKGNIIVAVGYGNSKAFITIGKN